MKAPQNIFRSLRRHYEAQPSVESFGQSFAFPNSTLRLSAVFTGAVQGQEVQSSSSSPAPAATTATAAATGAAATTTATAAATAANYPTATGRRYRWWQCQNQRGRHRW